MPYDVDIGDGADALGQNQLTDALDGTYWVSGWDATLGTGDLEVDIAAGSGAVAGTDVSTASTQTIDFTGDPDSTDPRKAVIYVDSGGTVQKALGTPQPVDPSGEIRFRTYNPSPPASVSGVVVAEVWLAAGETLLESADVRDRRVSNDAVESISNAPNYTEASVSRFTASGVPSIDISLTESFDSIWIFAEVTDVSGTRENTSVTVNNDTAGNWRYAKYDGTVEEGQTNIPFVIGTPANGTSRCELQGHANGDEAVTLDVLSTQIGIGAITAGSNTAISQINSIQFDRGANADWVVEIYGKTS